ncbi:unnamed protein product [Prorocentrum cordatum]|uniref:Uncharacterized protein n=1 Tax=Prorocentrum cordatum TaxID=2364126 RepID=A0ABN9SGN7_9DINO|nr:unnamed protein product [Polarella glacialis]
MAGCGRTSFSDMVEIVQFDAEDVVSSHDSSQSVGSTGPPCSAKLQSCSCPVEMVVLGGRVPGRLLQQAPIARAAISWGSSCSGVPEAASPPGGECAAPDGDDAQEAPDESALAKAAQRRRIRRSVTANQGPGLPQHALSPVTMSRILSRRLGSALSGVGSGSADGCIDCSAE